MPTSTPSPPDLRDEADPRELCERFQSLPEPAKKEFRARWQSQQRNELRMDQARRATRRRVVVEGALLFLLMQTIFAYVGFWRTVCAVLVGAAVGLAWHTTRARRFRYVIIGTGPHVAMGWCFGFGDLFTMFFGTLAFMVLATALGIAHESRLADGTDVY